MIKCFEFIKKNKLLILISILSIFLLVFSSSILIKSWKKNKEIENLQNRIASLHETIEISEGVFIAMANEERNIKRELDTLLSENISLRNELEDSKNKILALLSTEVELAENINFDSNRRGTIRVTREPIEQNDSIANNTESAAELGLTNPQMDNVIVEFDITELGFRVLGLTESNPPRAQLSLEQIEPFEIDLALTQSREGWTAYLSERQNRLNLSVSNLTVDPMILKEKWYERFGIGLAVSSGSQNLFGAGPAISIETQANLDIGASVIYNIERETQGQLNLTFRPFTRQ